MKVEKSMIQVWKKELQCDWSWTSKTLFPFQVSVYYDLNMKDINEFENHEN